MASKKHKNEPCKVLLPGDVVTEVESEESTKRLRIGPGLRHASKEGSEVPEVVSVKCGLLRHKQDAFWVDSSQKRVILCDFFG
jgi:hypothetical protein